MQAAKPIVRWMGGKRKLADQIIKSFPKHTCYVEPFAGGAAVLFAKPESRVEVLNDIDGELVNLYRVVQNHLDEFVRQFRWALTSRVLFDWAKQADTDLLTDIQRAARYYYINRLAFGGRMVNPSFGTAATKAHTFNLLRLEETLSMAHLRLSNVVIEHLPWADCVAKYDKPGTLFYLDPPYWSTAGYGGEFGFENYEVIAQVMGTMQGMAVWSINDHPDIRKLAKPHRVRTLKTSYTVGQGSGRSKQVTELLIANKRTAA